MDTLKESEINFDLGLYGVSITRSYYAVFYGSKALLLKKGVETTKHSGNIAKFGLEYVVKDNFDEKIAKILSKLEMDRTRADYNFEFDATEIIAKEDLVNAKKFLKECEKFLG